MNRALKITLIVLGSLIGIFFILALIAPKEYKVERSVNIKAAPPVILEQIRSLKNMHEWSPWRDYDPNMKVEFSGTDGQVGSKMSWTGNDDVGTGNQEITAVTDSRVDTKVIFVEPWQSEMDGYFLLEPAGGETKVTWGMAGKNPFPFNAFSLFMNMDEMIGKDFQKGLDKLKARVESNPNASAAAAPSYTIQEVDAPAMTYIMKKGEVTFEQIPAFFGEHLPKIFQEIEKQKLQPAGNPSGLFFKWDEKNMKTEMAAAVPVVGDEKTKVAGYETLNLPASKTLVIDYYGDYAKTHGAHYAMNAYMKEKKMEMNGPMIEEYITDPGVEKDTAKWLTKIYYKVK